MAIKMGDQNWHLKQIAVSMNTSFNKLSGYAAPCRQRTPVYETIVFLLKHFVNIPPTVVKVYSKDN